MIDLTPFIECNHSLLIAPAGHGKTTAIADCIKLCPDDECQLILTHTHAGIASLKSKFLLKNIPSSKYKLETITGFAQRYVLSILGSSVLPDENDKTYFNRAVEICGSLLESKSIKQILKSSFGGVFVDEYQDCTIVQHNMVMKLAEILPMHILGDPLQGIFSFGDSRLVDFDSDLNHYVRYELLDYPWRWNETNPALGQYILSIRKDLENAREVHLINHQQDGFHVIKTPFDENQKYSLLREVLNDNQTDSLLIIYPSYHEMNRYGKSRLRGTLTDRIELKQRVDYANKFVVIDAIDSDEYYASAKFIDQYIENCRRSLKYKRVSGLYKILTKMHLNKTELKNWIDENKNTIRQRKKENAQVSESLLNCFQQFEKDLTYENLKALISFIAKLPAIKLYHRIFYQTILMCFDIARLNNTTLYESMKILKTRVRHQGRRIQGRCIGTTLLTKGLEFDTVILWDAHKFQDSKNFYVAISRACKNLIILSDTLSIKFD